MENTKREIEIQKWNQKWNEHIADNRLLLLMQGELFEKTTERSNIVDVHVNFNSEDNEEYVEVTLTAGKEKFIIQRDYVKYDFISKVIIDVTWKVSVLRDGSYTELETIKSKHPLFRFLEQFQWVSMSLDTEDYCYH